MLSDWGELRKPSVFGWKNVGWAVAVHLAFFIACWLLSLPIKDPEVVIPIDMTVVVNENLDGDPDEPPPETPPVAAPEPTPPPPPVPVTPPKAEIAPPPEVKQDAVVKKPEKKIEKKKQEKTKEELKKEKEKRLEEMRKRATKPTKPVKEQPKKPTREEQLARIKGQLSNLPPPKNNGKTDKRPDNWKELRALGAKAGAHNQIPDSEMQRCTSLIKGVFDRAWEQVGIPPWTDSLREMHLELRFDAGGRVLSYRLSQSSGDRHVDATVLEAAKRMNAVRGLSAEFLASNGGNVTMLVKVKAR